MFWNEIIGWQPFFLYKILQSARIIWFSSDLIYKWGEFQVSLSEYLWSIPSEKSDRIWKALRERDGKTIQMNTKDKLKSVEAREKFRKGKKARKETAAQYSTRCPWMLLHSSSMLPWIHIATKNLECTCITRLALSEPEVPTRCQKRRGEFAFRSRRIGENKISRQTKFSSREYR